MFDHIAGRIPPVIKDLRAKDMPSHTPDALIILVGQPLMAQLLGVEVVDLERTVVHVCGGVAAHKEAVVVDKVGSAVDVREHRHVDGLSVLIDVQEIGGNDVEVGRVEADHGGEVGDA